MATKRREILCKFAIPLILYIVVFSTLYGIFNLYLNLPKRYSNPPSESYIDYWYEVMDDIKDATSLNPEINKTRLISYEGVLLNETHYYILSERYGGKDIMIHVVLTYNGNPTPKPCIVLIHGYGGNWTVFKDHMKELAKEGYVVLALDAPGASGNSTDFPSDDPENIVNTTNGPEYGYFYHVAYAVMRTITFATTLSFVDSKTIIVSGVSMGGLMTIITGAVDDRIFAIMPIVAAGNYLDSIYSGSFANGLVPKDVSIESIQAQNTMKFFDLYAYAKRIEKPVLYIAVTNDEYFNLVAFNDTFNAFNTTEKTLIIYPNSNHYGDPYWEDVVLDSVLSWLDGILSGAPRPKILSVEVTKKNYVMASKISVVAQAVALDNKVFLIHRDGTALSKWKISEMRLEEGEYRGEFSIIDSPSATLYVAIGKQEGDRIIILCATPIYSFGVKPLFLPITIIVGGIILLYVSLKTYQMSLREIKEHVLNKIREKKIQLSTWVVATTSIYAPAISMAGRKHLTIWEILERIKILLQCEGKIPVVSPMEVLSIAAIFLVMILYSIRERWLHLAYAAVIILLPHAYTIMFVVPTRDVLGSGFYIGFYLAIIALIIPIAYALFPRLKRWFRRH